MKMCPVVIKRLQRLKSNVGLKAPCDCVINVGDMEKTRRSHFTQNNNKVIDVSETGRSESGRHHL